MYLQTSPEESQWFQVTSERLNTKGVTKQIKYPRCFMPAISKKISICPKLNNAFFLISCSIWTASSEFGTYRLCEQRRFRRACAFAQSRQNLRCSLIQAVSQEEPSDLKARSLAPLNGCACAVKICHDGMLEDTNSLDAAHLIIFTTFRAEH